MGWQVQIGHQHHGYNGGLPNGVTAPYYASADTEIIFHVSTMLDGLFLTHEAFIYFFLQILSQALVAAEDIMMHNTEGNCKESKYCPLYLQEALKKSRWPRPSIV